MGAVPCLRAGAGLGTFTSLAASFADSTVGSGLTPGNIGASLAHNLLQNPMQRDFKVYSKKLNSKAESKQTYLREIYLNYFYFATFC